MSDKETFFLPTDDPDLDRDYITGREFKDGTRSAVRTISTDFDTNVVFAGDQACTDGSRVVLPQCEDDKMMTHRQVNVGRGYANHESLHKLLTDFDEGQKWLRKMYETKRGFTAHMGQAIEDVRIENGGKSLYPGMAKSIDKTAEQVCKEFKVVADKDPSICKDPWKVLPVAVTWIGRMKLGYPSPTIKQAFDQLAPDIQRRASLIADVVIGIPTGVKGVGQVDQPTAWNGSRQGMALAEKVANELAQDVPPPQEQPMENPNGNKSGDGSGSPSETSRRKSKGSSGAKDSEEETSSGLKEVENTTSRSHGASEGSEENVLQGEPQSFNPNLDQVVEHFVPKRDNKRTKTLKGSFTTEDDKIEEPKQAVREPDFYRGEYMNARNSMGSKLATMRRKLEKALITKTDTDYETSRTGKLNIRGKASSLIMGGANVRRKKVEGESIDTAVTLLVDCSGSMHGQPMVLAGHSAIALSECLSAGQIPYEVIGHTTTSLKRKNSDLFYDQGKRYERECGVYMPLFKPFDKNLNQCRHLMGFIPTASDNSNADADALLYAGRRLLEREESNKILMLLADGYPAWRGRGDQNQLTRDAVVRLQDQGVKCVGIGINCDSVKQFFENWVVVEDLNDLSKHVLDQVAKMILGNRFNVDNSDLIKSKRSA